MTALILGAVMFALLFAGFSALGVWQVQRLAWKQDLIRQVDARIHAAPVAARSAGFWRSDGTKPRLIRTVKP